MMRKKDELKKLGLKSSIDVGLKGVTNRIYIPSLSILQRLNMGKTRTTSKQQSDVLSLISSLSISQHANPDTRYAYAKKTITP